MRTRLPLALLTSFILIAAACGGDGDAPTLEGAAKDIHPGECQGPNGETLTVYSGRSEDLMAPVLDAFECSSGTEVQTRWGNSTELALLIGEEGDRTPADVFISQSPGPIGFLEAEGLLGSLDPSTLELVDPQNHSADGTWVGFSGRKRVLVHNIEDVATGDRPESVFELTGERYRNEVAIPGDNGSFEDWFTVFRDQHGDEVATQWLNDMVDNGARYYPNNRSIVDATSRGEIQMGLVNHYYNYQEALANGDDHGAANHDFADDDIGSLLIITAATVTADTEERDAATGLVEYLLAENVQRYLTDQTFEYPLAHGVEPASILPPLNALAIGTVDYDQLGGGLEKTTQIIEESGILSQ